MDLTHGSTRWILSNTFSTEGKTAIIILKKKFSFLISPKNAYVVKQAHV